MKTLVIGMDGATIETFKRGWTPFISSLIDQGERLELKEDIISRGWAEIFTGKHGIETGALYDRPDADGTLGWSIKFKIDDIPGLGSDVKPIWQVLNELGYKVGIMNVPTTYPAPAVNGFFVSGGGGGTKVVQDPTEELCYPKGILDDLIKEGYIVDERFWNLVDEKRIKDEKSFFSRINEKNLRRTKAFVKLASDYNIDFGFVVYRSSTNMAEFLTVPELVRDSDWQDMGENNLLLAAKEYYRSFDDQIKHLVEKFKGAEIIFVSDHGTSETKYLVNLNKFLQENNFQQISSYVANQKGVLRHLKRILKPMLPAKLRRLIIKNTKINSINNNFDQHQSLAFCMPMGEWSKGIYVNDEKRFNGPVPVSEIRSIAQQVSSCINSDKTANKFGLKSYVTPENDSIVSKFFPDVVIDCDDKVVSSNSEDNFIVKFEEMDRPIDLKRWINDFKIYSGKSNSPIAVSTKGWTCPVTDEKHDLRLVYDHIVSTFQN